MKVIYGIGKVKNVFKNVVLAIGVFDGLHKGHQALIANAIKRAKAIGGQAVIMTFAPHPVHVLHPHVHLPYIISIPLRLQFIAGLGAAGCIVIKFTKRFSKLSPQSFIKKYLVNSIDLKEIFVGDDFRFGQNRDGSLDFFKEAGRKHGFRVNVLDQIKGRGRKISSTLIRQLVAEGKLSDVRRYLNRPVTISGVVVKGEGRGKKLGFPTINIDYNDVVLPPTGVYAVYVNIGLEKYPAMANLGVKPSFTDKNKKINLEAHIFNFTKSLYGKFVTVEFMKRIRNEQKFLSKEKFIEQLKKDEKRARAILK